MSLESRLVQFLDGRGFSYRQGRKSLISDCLNPSCGKAEHMWIRRSNGKAICFRCGSRWSWRALVAAVARCSIDEAYTQLFGEGAGDYIELPLDPEIFTAANATVLGEEVVDSPVLMGPDFIPAEFSDEALRYVMSRGVFRPELIREYDLRYHAAMNAVVFPVRRGGVIFGWQARRIAPKDDELRLISCSFNKSRFLLNYDRAASERCIALVEGPFDCVHMDLPGVTGAVASLGKGVSLEQIRLLVESKAETVLVGLDPDASDEIYEVVDRIGLKKRVMRVTPPEHRKDFGECTEEEVMGAVESASSMRGSADYLAVHFKQ